MSTSVGIIRWASDNIAQARHRGLTLTKFVFFDGFEAHMAQVMFADKTVMVHEYTAGPVTKLMGIPCKFDRRVTNGRPLCVLRCDRV